LTVINTSEEERFVSPETYTPEISGFANTADADSALLALAAQFESLAAELLAAQPTAAELATCLDQQLVIHDGKLASHDADTRTKQVEAILARLYPIEQAIMQTPARTLAGLGAKALHAAHVMSQYWEKPVDQIDWEAQAIRLLIEAVCDVARTPLPFRNVGANE
jgi:hypothetical protein